MRGRLEGPGGGSEGAMAWLAWVPVADLESLWVGESWFVPLPGSLSAPMD